MKKLIPNYSASYRFYKFLPMIFGGLTIVLGTIFGIVDAFVEVTPLGDDLGISMIPIALIASVVLATIVCFLTTLCIAPTVVRTDATLEILATIKTTPSATPNNNASEEDEIPEL